MRLLSILVGAAALWPCVAAADAPAGATLGAEVVAPGGTPEAATYLRLSAAVTEAIGYLKQQVPPLVDRLAAGMTTAPAEAPLDAASLALGGGFHEGRISLDAAGDATQGATPGADGDPWRSLRPQDFGVVTGVEHQEFFAGLGLTYGLDRRAWSGDGVSTEVSTLAAPDGTAVGGRAAVSHGTTKGSVTFGPKLELGYLSLPGEDWGGAIGQGQPQAITGSAGVGASGSFALPGGVARPFLQADVGTQLGAGPADDSVLPKLLQNLAPGEDEDLYGSVTGGIDFDLSNRASVSVNAESFLLGEDNRTLSVGASVAF